jgi:hypothetical protein
MSLALTSLPSENLKLTAVIGLRTISKTERGVMVGRVCEISTFMVGDEVMVPEL